VIALSPLLYATGTYRRYGNTTVVQVNTGVVTCAIAGYLVQSEARAGDLVQEEERMGAGWKGEDVILRRLSEHKNGGRRTSSSRNTSQALAQRERRRDALLYASKLNSDAQSQLLIAAWKRMTIRAAFTGTCRLVTLASAGCPSSGGCVVSSSPLCMNTVSQCAWMRREYSANFSPGASGALGHSALPIRTNSVDQCRDHPISSPTERSECL